MRVFTVTHCLVLIRQTTYENNFILPSFLPFRCWYPIRSYKCQKPCQRLMPCDVHSCTKTCSSSCGQCMEFVDVQSPCGHVVRVQCRDSKDRKSLRNACDTLLEIELPCGHMGVVECCENTVFTPSDLMDVCEQPTRVTCSSGHESVVACSISRQRNAVDKLCEFEVRVMLVCGHSVEQPCKRDRHKIRSSADCEEFVKLVLPCGHETEVPCKEKDEKFTQATCQFPIEETLECGHRITRKCSEIVQCTEKVTVSLSCGHAVVIDCLNLAGENSAQEGCEVKCGDIMRCGHRCPGSSDRLYDF